MNNKKYNFTKNKHLNLKISIKIVNNTQITIRKMLINTKNSQPNRMTNLKKLTIIQIPISLRITIILTSVITHIIMLSNKTSSMKIIKNS